MAGLKLFVFFAFFIAIAGDGYCQSEEIGLASFYSDTLEGRLTSSGEVYKMNRMTAAHRILPFNTKIRVTNLHNDRSVIVTINDRGPYVEGRIVDLSKSAAIKLDFIEQGITRVKLEIVQKG